MNNQQFYGSKDFTNELKEFIEQKQMFSVHSHKGLEGHDVKSHRKC